MPPLPEARGAGALVLLGRDLHFFGGNDAEHEDRGEHWVLSLEGGSDWTPAAPLPNPRNHLGFLVLGGEVGLNDYVDDVLSYDPEVDTWTSLTPLPQAINSGVAGIVGGRIYIHDGGAFSTATYRGVPSR